MIDEFDHAGLVCKVYLTPMGHHCGYVGVDPDHPWFGLGYNDVVSVSDAVFGRRIDADKVGVINLLCATDLRKEALPIVLAVDVHGGLTFAGKDKDRDLWWFGFDCAHSGDGRSDGQPEWRDQAYVADECRSLADQLAKAAAPERVE